MDQTKIYDMDTASAPLSPKPSSTSSITTPCTDRSNKSSFSNPSTTTTTPYSKIAISPEFETLYEKSNDNCVLDNTFFNTTNNFDLNQTNSSSKRKRKLASPDSSIISNKRKCDASYSEKSRKKISEFFKTPINYFSSRRRTIGVVNKSLNESVLSSSGIFDVSTVENLNKTSNESFSKKVRNSLFSRTFSSAKLKRGKKKVKNLNCTRLSFGDTSECDGVDNLNSSCFPDISALPVTDSEMWMHRQQAQEHPGPSFSHASVLTSFQFIQGVTLKILPGYCEKVKS